MFNQKIALLTLCIAMPTTSFAASQYIAGDNSRATQLCISAASDAPIAFLVKQRESGYSMHYIARNVVCNEISISKFAQQAGNNKNANRIAKFVPVKAQTGILDLSQQQHKNPDAVQQNKLADDANRLIVVVGH